MPKAYLPDLVWADGWHREALVVDDHGVVVSLGEPPIGAAVERLAGRALLPGLVNAHSHAFQRAIRGRTEYRSSDEDDFWSWRDQMYRAAAAISPDELRAVSRAAFLEMLRAGITSAGEFHYLHRDPKGRPYGDPAELEHQVLAAAADVGLRLVLLRVAYARGGPGKAAAGAQLRFCDDSIDGYVRACEALAGKAAVGVAPHSVRALPREWLAPLGDFAARRGLPVHVHLAEQRKEVEACVAEHGRRPVELCDAEGLLGERFTAVHAIHLAPAEIARLGATRSSVCACPTTERNLGDGVVPAPALLQAGATVALGSDGQSQIDLLEDARELDYHLRLATERRAVLGPRSGDRASLARVLFSAATEGGARSLALPTGALRPGAPADFFTVDLADLSIAGTAEDALLPSIVFGLARGAVREVAVQGNVVLRDGRHAQEERTVRELERSMEALWARA
ncbi:MAG TPA: formimidoylglutamate deiminase [Myxococcales bacterium]|nr:formimidoylglutamate deiminase [Myxococcales bacterium]